MVRHRIAVAAAIGTLVAAFTAPDAQAMTIGMQDDGVQSGISGLDSVQESSAETPYGLPDIAQDERSSPNAEADEAAGLETATIFETLYDSGKIPGFQMFLAQYPGESALKSRGNRSAPNRGGIVTAMDVDEAPTSPIVIDVDRTPTSPVPEPGTMALLGIGLIGVVGASRRRMLK